MKLLINSSQGFADKFLFIVDYICCAHNNNERLEIYDCVSNYMNIYLDEVFDDFCGLFDYHRIESKAELKLDPELGWVSGNDLQVKFKHTQSNGYVMEKFIVNKLFSKLKTSITNKVNLNISDFMCGVHIRGTDKTLIYATEEQSIEIERADKELLENNYKEIYQSIPYQQSNNLFICSSHKIYEDYFTELVSNKNIFSNPKNTFNRHTKDGMIEGILDLLFLSKCDYIYHISKIPKPSKFLRLANLVNIF